MATITEKVLGKSADLLKDRKVPKRKVKIQLRNDVGHVSYSEEIIETDEPADRIIMHAHVQSILEDPAVEKEEKKDKKAK